MKIISKLLFSLILILGLASCERDQSASLESSNLLTKLEIQKIGIQHNEALGYVLEGLKKTDVSKFKNTGKMKTFLNEELGKYYNTQSLKKMFY